MTRTQLLEDRRKEGIPDITYDLDNDGQVSGRDYCMARKFDKGFKNYLTKEEKEEAIEALKNGFEDNFVWNVEATGAMRQQRLQQVRGALCEAEDYLEVTKTYPKHPLSDIVPYCATATELTALRK